MTRTTSKRIYRKYLEYTNSEKKSLHDCYNCPSLRKQIAFDWCKELQRRYGGHDGRIISHNTCVFTYGFLAEIDNMPIFIYITPTQTVYIELV